MTVELRVEDGDASGRVFAIEEGASKRIGRAPDCEIHLSGISDLSRYHCTVENRDGVLHVTDLQSENGTFINDQPIHDGVLEAGDVLRLCRTTLSCRPTDRPNAVTPARSVALHDASPHTVVRKVVDTKTFGADPIVAPSRIAREDELRRAQRSLAAAYQVSKTLATAANVDALFDGVLGSILAAIDADRVALLLKPEGDDGGDATAVATRVREGVSAGPRIEISRTVVRDVLDNGVSILSQDAGADSRYRDAASVVSLNIRSVLCAPVATDEATIGVLYADNQQQQEAFGEGELELLALIGNQAGVAIHRARLATALEQFFLDTIRAMVATIDAKDGYTHRHSERVSATAVALARELGLGADELSTVRLSGLLHDVGKIGVAESILNKPGKLTEREFDEMKSHTIHGERILRHIQNPSFRSILPGVRSHHERWDGTGYPDQLSGADIPMLGRLIAVADTLDALSSDRVYRSGSPLEETVTYIAEHAGQWFDPDVVRAMRALHQRGALMPAAEGDGEVGTQGADS